MSRYREVPISPEMREGEDMPESKVVLHFFRHDRKENSRPEQDDKDVELTIEGRSNALQMGKLFPSKIETSWAAGSERIRSAHTALNRMAAQTGLLTPRMSYEQASRIVNEELKVGKKVTMLPELGFSYEEKFYETVSERIRQGHFLEFVANESDALALKQQDTTSSTYSRAAANFASLIAREMRAANAWQRVVREHPEKYADQENTMERYLGSHQVILENMYMKVVEKTHGREKLLQFIENMRDEEGKANGFDFHEGYTFTITNGTEGQKLMLEGIRGFENMEVTPELLQEIIDDAIHLDEAIEKSSPHSKE
ncbi:MAG: hypothetical protein Q8Q20_00185 [bacterium]|nr:hypothetical protein [bacterium]